MTRTSDHPQATPTAVEFDALDPEKRLAELQRRRDELGDRVGLEQERIDWAWASDRLPFEPA